jgi:phosphoribosylformylglycinamidine synthase
MEAVRNFAAGGGLVIGICNGFQILLESGLLPGAMLRNKGLKYVCRHVHVQVETVGTPFTGSTRPGSVLRIPIGHMEGNYFADEATLQQLEQNGQIVFRYCSNDGQITDAANPNGSLANIAGVCNEQRNVLGMMPHPERASEAVLGCEDGLVIFRSMMSLFVHAG